MKLLLVSALLLLSPAAAGAVDVTAPVQKVMAITAANWNEETEDDGDIFAPELLETLYSRDFVAKYREAAKFPAYDGGDSPFDYDVITGGQDGCALEGVKITAGATKDGRTDVVAEFKNTTCFGTEAEYQVPTEVHFDVIEEAGKAVIDDVRHAEEEFATDSLKADMQVIASP